MPISIKPNVQVKIPMPGSNAFDPRSTDAKLPGTWKPSTGGGGGGEDILVPTNVRPEKK